MKFANRSSFQSSNLSWGLGEDSLKAFLSDSYKISPKLTSFVVGNMESLRPAILFFQ
jgi:hypothetical protein